MKTLKPLALLLLCSLFGPLFAQDFEVPVTVSDGTNIQDLTIGVDPLGTSGFDPGLDIFAPPPPPGGGFDARLSWLAEDYFTDIRSNTAPSDTFVMTYSPELDTMGVPLGSIVLTWDTTGLSNLGCFQITDNLTGNLFSLDMTATNILEAGLNPLLDAGIRILLTYPEILGDVNGDDLANSTDALIALSFDAGFPLPPIFISRINRGIGDVNFDTFTNSTDALILLSFDAGFPLPFPVGEPLCFPDSSAPSTSEFIPSPAKQEPGITASAVAANAKITNGQIINVPVVVDMNNLPARDPSREKLGSFTAVLEWDPAVFLFVSYSGGSTPGFENPVVNDTEARKGKLIFANANPHGADGLVNILNLQFEADAPKEAGTSLSLKFNAMAAAKTFIDLLPYLNVTDSEVSYMVEDPPENFAIENYPNPFNNGQFSVVSTSPAHGAAGVDTSVTFSVTFNSPVDTSARFPFPPEFFINIFFYPDTLIGKPDSITLSPDLTTVYVHNPHFYPNTDYLFVINDAIGQAGDSLETPHSLVFSTANSLPAASVSGTVSYPGSDPTGTLVALLDGTPFGEEGEIVNGKVIAASGGAYTVDYVAPGTYWPAAIKNFYVNSEGSIEPQPGSAIGFYDVDGDYTPDSIVVTAGAQVSGIDFSLAAIFAQTARAPYPLIESLAQTWAADAILIGLGSGEMEPDGNSLSWQYGFYSPVLMQHRAWQAMGSLAVSVPGFGTLADTQVVPQNWLNSDTVMAVAEAHGGEQFRQVNPDAEIFAFLGYLNFGNKGKKNTPGAFSQLAEKIIPQPLPYRRGWQGLLPESPASDNTEFSRLNREFSFLPAIWFVQYYSPSAGTEFFLFIDAETGVALSEPSTAATAEEMALPVAQNWATDAKLWAAVSQGTPLDSLGRTQFWNCLYYSPSLDSLHAVVVWGQRPIFSGPQTWIWPDTSTIPPNWLDSDVSIAVAEAGGGAAYRSANQDVFVSAFLSRWYHVPSPGLTVWAFEYISSSAPPLEILVDALSGTIVGIGESNLPKVPEHWVLEQNYPNPFNAATTIRYRLPKRVEVKLEIFDVRGRLVAKLVDTVQNTGYYSVKWDASAVSSGLYFYRLTAGEFIDTRKLILIK